MGMIFREKFTKLFLSALSADQRSYLRFVKKSNFLKVTEPQQPKKFHSQFSHIQLKIFEMNFLQEFVLKCIKR